MALSLSQAAALLHYTPRWGEVRWGRFSHIIWFWLGLGSMYFSSRNQNTCFLFPSQVQRKPVLPGSPVSWIDTAGIGNRLAYLLSHPGNCSKEQQLSIPSASFSCGSEDSYDKRLSSSTGSYPRSLPQGCEFCRREKRNRSTFLQERQMSHWDLSPACWTRCCCTTGRPVWSPSCGGAPTPALQILVMFTGDFRVIFSLLKTRWVFQFIAHDSDYFSTFKILSLGSIVCITLWALSRISCSDLQNNTGAQLCFYNERGGRWESNCRKEAQQKLLKSKTDLVILLSFPNDFFIL